VWGDQRLKKIGRTEDGGRALLRAVETGKEREKEWERFWNSKGEPLDWGNLASSRDVGERGSSKEIGPHTKAKWLRRRGGGEWYSPEKSEHSGGGLKDFRAKEKGKRFCSTPVGCQRSLPCCGGEKVKGARP